MILQVGDVVVVEHKTAGGSIDPGSRYWQKLTLDTQVSNYAVGVRALGHEPAGTLYDVIRKLSLDPYKATPIEERTYTKGSSKACPACKKKGGDATAPHLVELEPARELDGGGITAPVMAHCVRMWKDESGTWRYGEGDEEGKELPPLERRIVSEEPRLHANQRTDDETLAEFRARCLAEVGADPEKYYQRQVVVRLEEDERAAAYDTWRTAAQIAEAQRVQTVIGEHAWPRNPDSCELYGRLCEYHVVCTRAGSLDDESIFETKQQHSELDAPRKFTLPLLTTSSAKSFRACNRKYYNAYVLRRRERKAGFALRWGTLMHAGLEAWWKGSCAEEYPTAALLAMHTANERDDLQIDQWDMTKAEVLLLGYHMKWRAEALDVLHVEQEFEALLVNPETNAASRTWVRGGKLDAVARVAPAQEIAQA